MAEQELIIAVDSTDVEKAAERFDQLSGAAEAAADSLDDVGDAGDDASRGLDDAADSASRMGRQSQGATAGIGRMVAGIGAAILSVEMLKKGFAATVAALRDYTRDNASAQLQTVAFTDALADTRTAYARMLIDTAEATGLLRAMESALRGVESAFDAIGRNTASGLREVTNPDQLERYRGQLREVGRDLRTLQSELDSLTFRDVISGHAQDVRDEWQAATNAFHEYEAAIEEGSRRLAQGAVDRIRQSVTLAQFGGPNAEQAPATGAAGSPEEAQKDLQAVLAAQVAAVKAADYERRAAMIAAFNATAELEQLRIAELQATAQREIEIEASKNAAIADMRAQAKAAELAAIEAQRERIRSALASTRDITLTAAREISTALGAAAVSGDGEALRQSIRSTFAGALSDLAQMIRLMAAPMLIPAPGNVLFAPVKGAALLASSFALDAFAGAAGAQRGGGTSTPTATTASRELPTERERSGVSISQSISFGFVGDRRAAIREIQDLSVEAMRLGMAEA